MNWNWVDWVILAVGAYYIFEGWEYGLIRLTSNLISFLLSLWLAIRFHAQVGIFLSDKFGVPSLWATVLGYILVAILTEMILVETFRQLINKLPQKLLSLKINNLLGAALSLVNAGVIAAFVLLVVLALPIRGSARDDIKTSVLGSNLVRLAETYGGSLKSSLDQVTAQAVRFMTVKPSSNESIDLRLDSTKLSFKVNEQAEKEMLELVNAEREKVGVKPLVVDNNIVPVARAHSRDMFERSYFSHYSPEGHDAGYRLDQGGVVFTVAGENLAYAPNVKTAHEGLMNSEGHKKNILEPQFGRIGIGVIDAGNYGLMFTQNFAD